MYMEKKLDITKPPYYEPMFASSLTLRNIQVPIHCKKNIYTTKRKPDKDTIRRLMSPLQNLDTYLDTTWQRFAGWQAIHASRSSYHKAFECDWGESLPRSYLSL